MFCGLCPREVLPTQGRVTYYRTSFHITCFVNYLRKVKDNAIQKIQDLATSRNPVAVDNHTDGNNHFVRPTYFDRRIKRCRSSLQRRSYPKRLLQECPLP